MIPIKNFKCWPADKIKEINRHNALNQNGTSWFDDNLYQTLSEKTYRQEFSWFFWKLQNITYSEILYKRVKEKLDFLFESYQNKLKEEKIAAVKQLAKEFG